MSLKEERQALVSILETIGVVAYGYIPARFTPPAAVVMSGSPYLIPSSIFGEFEARWDISLATNTAANEVMTDALDALIEDVAVTLINAGYDLIQVSEHKVYPSNNAEYPAVDMTIAKNITI